MTLPHDRSQARALDRPQAITDPESHALKHGSDGYAGRRQQSSHGEAHACRTRVQAS